MHTEINSNLPYIKINNPPIKLLIDTGCSQSILRPIIAEKYFPNEIFQQETLIKTGIGEKLVRFKANIPAFSELKINETITFTLFDFHSFFDGILGLDQLKKLKLFIDLKNNFLVNDILKIPLHFNKTENISHDVSVNSYEIASVKIPVNVYEGDIIIPESYINHLHFPETLTTAVRGYAKTEVFNRTDEHLMISFSEPVKVIPFPDSRKENFEFFNIETFLPKSELNKNLNIANLIRTEHLNTEEKQLLTSLCKDFSDIFHEENQKLTFTNKIKHEIKTSDEIPAHSKTYRYPFVHKQEVQKQINKMLEDGIIRPSQSPWSSPIWIVPKKLDASGRQKWRIVVDYRKINEKTIDDRYPLPNINDILDKLGRCQYFSTLDLASGFHQIEMHPNSIEKTAFNVENGHYEYLRMPFGLKNAPATFQRVMDHVLRDLQHKVCLVYMDDIIIFSTTLEEHIKNLRSVFQKLREAKFKVQLDKSEFLCKEVEFLGHVITPEGVKPNPRKIEAITRFPIPKTAKEIKSFLGLLGYYRRFIKNFAKLTKPFTKCLKKGEKIEHTSEFVDTFELCKKILCNDPILKYPDFEKPFVLTTDASNVAIGAVLSQGKVGNDLPIAYASRTLNPAETNYSTIEKELLAIVWATKYFRPYLFGRKFLIVTDHKPLQWLFNLKEPSSRLVRWRLKLEEYTYEIVYKKGKSNTNADALSRVEINMVENESIIGNPGDSDDDILKYLDDCSAEISMDALEELEHALELDKGIELPEARPVSDNETVHSSAEDPILNVPITENPVNFYNNQIIIIQNDSERYYVIRSNPFENKNRKTVHISKNVETDIIKFFKEHVDPKKTYCIFIQKSDVNLNPRISVILQRTFKNHSYHLTISNSMLNDVTRDERRNELIKYHHEKTCHRGINEVLLDLRKLYFWPNMKQDIVNYINNCEICQQAKYDRHPPKIKFSLTATPSEPLESIHMDTLQIQNTKFLTIIDVFSRYTQAYPLEPVCTAATVYEGFLNFITHFGIPKLITCDNGTEFKTSLLIDFCKLHKIAIHFTTPGNSNSNSPIERVHSSLLENCRVLKLQDENLSIKQTMQYAILGYNSSVHSVTKQKPFDIIHGRLKSIDPFDLTDDIIVNQYISDRKEKLKLLYNKITEQSNNSKEKTIRKRNEKRENPPTFSPGSKCYVKNKMAARSKTKAKHTKHTVRQNLDNKIITDKNKVIHKSQIKRPLNSTNIPSQDTQNEDEVDPSQPSCSYTNTNH